MKHSFTLSKALVGAQFLLIALLVLPISSAWPRTASDLPGVLLVLAALVLVVVAYRSMSHGTFTVVPEPRDTATLVTQGPYAVVRHPMYTAALLGGLGVSLIRASLIDGVLLAALALVLVIKLRREEHLLLARFPDYAVYRSHTSALLPGLY